MTQLVEIMKKFGINNVVSCRRIMKGKINETYLVETPRTRYILQKMKQRTIEAADSERNFYVANERTKSYVVVSEALEAENLISARPLQVTGSDSYVYRSEDGQLWRAFDHIPHDEDASMNEQSAFSVGQALGVFHNSMSRLDFRPEFSIPEFHDTPKILTRLQAVAKEKGDSKLLPVKNEYDYLLEKTERLFLPSELPQAVIHGDPKFDNFLFENHKVKAVIDFDNMMVGSIYLDIGDAFRSWCRVNGRFDSGIFDKAKSAYEFGAGESLDQALALQSVKLISLELATRYLIDYFLEEHFSWDSDRYASAADHNLVRAREMIEYYKTIIF